MPEKITAEMVWDRIADLDRTVRRRDEEIAQLKEKVNTVHRTGTYGTLPYMTTGPLGGDSQPFSMLKAMGVASGRLSPDDAKYECSVHAGLKSMYSAGGFHGFESKSFLVPAWSKALWPNSSAEESFVRELNQRNSAWRQKDFDPTEAAYYSKAMGSVSDIVGGTLVGFPTLGELVEMQKNLETFSRAGASQIALPSNGRLSLPRHTGASTAYWVTEASQITQSDAATGSLLLEAKKAAVLVKCNNELFRYASPTLEGLLHYDMSSQAALLCDLAMLQGTGGGQIKGLLNYETQSTWSMGSDKVLLISATNVTADGDTLDPKDIFRLKSVLSDPVQAADEGQKAWVLNPRLWQLICAKRGDSVAVGDGQGAYIFNALRNDGVGPRSMDGNGVFTSSQVSATRVKGASSNLTFLLFGQFREWLIARFGVLELLPGYDSDSFSRDQTMLRAISLVDAGPRHLSSFGYVDSLKFVV